MYVIIIFIYVFFGFREMLLTGAWPTNMQYLTCDAYDGTNTPERSIDLKSYFVNANEPASYGNFSFPTGNVAFNGHSYMKFDMDISVVSVQGGASVSTKVLGNWTAGLSSPITVKSADDMKNFTAAVVYRVYTVVVCDFEAIFKKLLKLSKYSDYVFSF